MPPVIILWAHPHSMSTATEGNHLRYDKPLREYSETREQHGS